MREGIVHYIIEILKLLPDGLIVGFQEPGGPALGCSSGPLGPGGSWNFEASYRVWGFQRGPASDAVFDAFKRLFDAWGWTYRYEDDGRSRDLDAWTNKKRKYAFHVNITRYSHGGVSMVWTSPYYPAKYADRDLDMPSVITKDGIRSWKDPVYDDSDRVVPGSFTEVIRYYDIWRRIVGLTRNETYYEADWESGRLYFRSDYLDKLTDWPQWREKGDWGAWIIDPTPDGHYNVLHSVMPERSNNRQETVEVVFSRLADAGKYIIAQIGDSARMGLRLPTVAMQWDDSGLDPRIEVLPADSAAVDYPVRVEPATNRQAAEQHLKIYRLREQPGTYALAFPGEPYMQVLALSFEELNRSLLDGMPNNITSQLTR